MTEEKETKITATTKKQSQSIKGETMFHRDEILQNPQAFGVSGYVLLGAMADMTDEQYSRSQVQEAIKSFSKRKVEQK